MHPIIELMNYDSSRQAADNALDYLDNHPEVLEVVFQECINDAYPEAFRAARVFDYHLEKNPQLIDHYFDKIIDTASKAKVDGVRRNFLRILTRYKFKKSEELNGELLELCFDTLSKRTEAIAIRACALKIIANMVKVEPLLAPELAETIRFVTPEASPGLKRLFKQVLREIKC